MIFLISLFTEGNEFRSKNRGVQKELLSLMDGTFVNTTRLGRISVC
jgi:ATP-dependent protease HslVU (ClpYQ) ATPase subunit